MRGEAAVVPPMLPADPAQPCPLAQVLGSRCSSLCMAAPLHGPQCLPACGCKAKPSSDVRLAWTEEPSLPAHCCTLGLPAAGPAAAAVHSEPPGSAGARGGGRHLPSPAGAHARCGTRAEAVAFPTPGGVAGSGGAMLKLERGSCWPRRSAQPGVGRGLYMAVPRGRQQQPCRLPSTCPPLPALAALRSA